MYTSTFVFAAKAFDAEFHRLDDAIATAARVLHTYGDGKLGGVPGAASQAARP